MDAREHHRVFSASARPSSWPLVRRPWLRATKGVHAATVFNLRNDTAALAAEPIGTLSARRPLATACMHVTSNCAAPIQYP